MSFKDDFKEALRSVKRDLFRENESFESPPENSKSSLSNLNDYTNSQRSAETIAEIMSQEDYNMQNNNNTENYDPNQFASEAVEVNGADLTGGSSSAGDTYTENESFLTGISDFDEKNEDYNRDWKGSRFNPESMFSEEKTVISRNTVIRGQIHTEDSLSLFGQILGDIECKSNIVVAGKVRGNTSAANAYIIDAQVDGNLYCDDVVNINKEAWVLGDIRANEAEIEGKIKGNIEVKNGLSIGPVSSIIGNISTDELEIKRGAFVNGQIIMYNPSRDVIDRFDDFE